MIVQKDSLTIDIAASLEAIETFIDSSADQAATLAATIGNCDAVICDISALGILAAKIRGIPAILIENFRWDWIYRQLAVSEPRFEAAANWFSEVYSQAQHQLQTAPICELRPNATSVAEIVRPLRLTRSEVRTRLAVADTTVIVLSMPAEEAVAVLDSRSAQRSDLVFIVPGLLTTDRHRHARTIPEGMRHPDLLVGADLVIGKIGYSTCVEVRQAGCRFAYYSREWFPESTALEAYVKAWIPSTKLGTVQLPFAEIEPTIDALLLQVGNDEGLVNELGGAKQAAQQIASWLSLSRFL